MKNIIKSFRLIKYSDGFVTNVLLSLVLTFAGIFVLLMTNYASLGCILSMLGFGVISTSFFTVPLTESIAVSPRSRIFEKTIPNIITICGTIFTYIVLSVIAYYKFSPTSIIHEFITENAAIKFYFKGILSIMIMSMVLAGMSKHFALNMTITILLPIIAKFFFVFALLLGTPFGAFPRVNDLLGGHVLELKPLTAPTMFLWAVPAIIVGLIFSILIRKKCYNAPFAIYFKATAERAYKKANKGNLIFQNKFFFATCIVAILAITTTIMVSYINYMKPDGWYDRSHLKAQYRELLKDCNEEVTLDGITFTLTKKYYDAVTKDGCCLFTVEVGDKAELNYQLSAHESTFLFSAYKDPRACDTYYLIMEGDGNIYMECEPDENNTNKAYVYVYFSMVPENDKDISICIYNEESELTETGNIRGELCHRFDLGDTTESINYTVDKFDVAVSRAGILFYDKVIPSTLNVVMKNGDIIKVVENSSLVQGFEKYESKTHDKYSFKDIIDINQVESIELTGKNYFTENGEFNPDEFYSSCENSNIKETIIAKYDKDTNGINIKYTIEWQNMPRFRETDFILLRFDKMDYFTDDEHDLKVTHKVYETHTSDNGKEYKQWIEDELKPGNGLYNTASYTLGDISTPIPGGPFDIIPNKYSFGATYNFNSEGMCICPTLYIDTDNRTYEKESIVIEMTLDRDYNSIYNNPRIQCFYLHQKENIVGRLQQGDLGETNVSGIVNCNFIHEIDLDSLGLQD